MKSFSFHFYKNLIHNVVKNWHWGEEVFVQKIYKYSSFCTYTCFLLFHYSINLFYLHKHRIKYHFRYRSDTLTYWPFNNNVLASEWVSRRTNGRTITNKTRSSVQYTIQFTDHNKLGFVNVTKNVDSGGADGG